MMNEGQMSVNKCVFFTDVTICAVAIGDPVEDIADKSMLKKISSSRCFFEFFSWKDYHDIIALVIENSSVGSN